MSIDLSHSHLLDSQTQSCAKVPAKLPEGFVSKSQAFRGRYAGMLIRDLEERGKLHCIAEIDEIYHMHELVSPFGLLPAPWTEDEEAG